MQVWMFSTCECMFLDACVACFGACNACFWHTNAWFWHANACFWMHALRVFDMRMHDFDMRMHDFDMRMHVFGCTRCVFSTCECMILTCECMFSMHALHVFHAIDGMLTCQNIALTRKRGFDRIPGKPGIVIWIAKTRFWKYGKCGWRGQKWIYRH